MCCLYPFILRCWPEVTSTMSSVNRVPLSSSAHVQIEGDHDVCPFIVPCREYNQNVANHISITWNRKSHKVVQIWKQRNRKDSGIGTRGAGGPGTPHIFRGGPSPPSPHFQMLANSSYIFVGPTIYRNLSCIAALLQYQLR